MAINTTLDFEITKEGSKPQFAQPQVKVLEISEKQEDIIFGRGKCRTCNCQGFSSGWGDNCTYCGHPYSHHENA